MFLNVFVRLNILVASLCCYHNVCERFFCRTNGCPSSLHVSILFPSTVLTVFPTAFMCLSYYLIFLPMIFCFPSSRTHLTVFLHSLERCHLYCPDCFFFLSSPCVCVTYIVPTVFSLLSMCLCHLYCPHCFFFTLHVSMSLILSPLFFL